MVAFEDPGDGAVGEGAEDGGGLHREAPEAEEFGGALGRGEVADDGAAGGLGGAHAETREVRRDPEEGDAFGDVGEGDHDDPADQHQGHGLDVANGVLQVAEAEGADGGGDVDDQHQHDGLGAGEFHRFLRVDGGEGDDRHDARLIEQDADEEAAQVAEMAGLPEGSQHLMPRAFACFPR